MEILPERMDEKPANDDARKLDYDADGRVCQITDHGIGQRTTLVFDHADNLAKVIGPDAKM